MKLQYIALFTNNYFTFRCVSGLVNYKCINVQKLVGLLTGSSGHGDAVGVVIKKYYEMVYLSQITHLYIYTTPNRWTEAGGW